MSWIDALGLVVQYRALNASAADSYKNYAEYRTELAIRQFVPPIIFVVGTFGNVMAITIMHRKEFRRQRSAMPVMITALAVCDTVLLYIGLLRIWISGIFNVDIRKEHLLVCKIHTWTVYATKFTDAWILAAMTIERMMSVVKPHQVHVIFTRRRAHYIVAGITLFFFAISAHIPYGLDIRVNKQGAASCMARDEDYDKFFLGPWAWFDLMVHCLIPVIVLITGNTVIIWKMKASARVSVSSGHAQLIHKKRIAFLSKALLLLSLVFLLTTLPIGVMNVMELTLRQLTTDPKINARISLAWQVVYIMMYMNNAVNFYIYCLSGSLFRRELKAVLRCKAEPETATPKTSTHMKTCTEGV